MKTNRVTLLLGAALFVSLSINLFIAGMMVGGSVSARVPALSATEQQDQRLRDSLSDVDKLVLKQAMDSNRTKITHLHNELEDLKGNIRSLIKQEPLSEKSLNNILEEQKKKELALVRLVYQTRKEAMDKMSPEGRVILAKTSRLGFNLNPCH